MTFWKWNLLILLVTAHSVCAAQEPNAYQADEVGFQTTVQPFLKSYCVSCHSKAEAEGDLRLDNVTADLASDFAWQHWQEVRDRLNVNDMPPQRAEKQPSAAERLKVIHWLNAELAKVGQALRKSDSELAMRRLNRNEYQNTIRDLLGLPFDEVINYPQLTHAFPADSSTHGFDTVSDGLTVSSLHMEKYLKHGRAVIDAALERPATAHWRIDYCEQDSEQYKALSRKLDAQWWDSAFWINLRKDRGDRPFNKVWLDQVKPINEKLALRPGEFVQGDSYRVVRRRKDRVEAYTFAHFRTQAEGIYRFEVRARLNGTKEGSAVIELVRGEKRDIAQRRFLVEHRDFATYDFQEYFPSDKEVKFMAWVVPVGRKESYEGLVMEIDFVELEGPLRATDDQEQQFFLGTSEKITAEIDEDQAVEMLRHFAARAYRRNVTEEEVDGLRKLFLDSVEASGNANEALRETLGFILASPDFIYHDKLHRQADAKELGDFELATRLSYFLWSSMPDEELMRLAEAGELRQPDVLKQQLGRMLDDPKVDALVKNFCGQWLRIREVPEIVPVKEVYPRYNEELQDDMMAETYAFFAELLREDLSILNFIDSDFTMMNENLARHYQMEKRPEGERVIGRHIRRVALKPEENRGGVLAHASVLKLTSTCIRTSPVKRGAFILENFLDTVPDPPPPNAGEVVTGAPGSEPKTLREKLQQHRTQATCAACHDKIDPLGFALHHYDAIGKYRTHEAGEAKKDNLVGPIDASGTLSDGRSFNGLQEFKQVLLQDEERFTRCLTKKLLVYALGRPVGLADEPAIDDICNQVADEDHRFRALLEAIVMSETFQKP